MVVHVTLGLVSAVAAGDLEVRPPSASPLCCRPAACASRAASGTSKIPQNQISFAIYKGSQFEAAERAALLPSVAAGDVVLLPEGTYYIISKLRRRPIRLFRSDIRVQAGKLTDVIITHRAAVITLKLVGDKGGEALANTAWSVIHAGRRRHQGNRSARFPRVILSEGEYRAIAKNEGKVFERPFKRRQRRRRRNRSGGALTPHGEEHAKRGVSNHGPRNRPFEDAAQARLLRMRAQQSKTASRYPTAPDAAGPHWASTACRCE